MQQEIMYWRDKNPLDIPRDLADRYPGQNWRVVSICPMVMESKEYYPGCQKLTAEAFIVVIERVE